MEKSRQRLTNPEIIDSWKYKSYTRIILESFLTLAFWTGFLYLLTPVVTLVLWLFGVRIAYSELIGPNGLIELVKIIKNGFFITSIVTVCILAWGYYNYLLFWIRGERRNSQVKICFDADFSAYYQLDLQTLQAAKEQSCLSVTLTDNGMEVQRMLALPVPPFTIVHGKGKINRKKKRNPASDSSSQNA
jgi:biofilm PGA synthesis protein PgaD